MMANKKRKVVKPAEVKGPKLPLEFDEALELIENDEIRLQGLQITGSQGDAQFADDMAAFLEEGLAESSSGAVDSTAKIPEPRA